MRDSLRRIRSGTPASFDNERVLDQRFLGIDENISKRFADFDDDISKRFADSNLNWERRITDSEMRQTSLITASEQRQESRVNTITTATGSLESWRQESEGEFDDLKLKMTKLTKYYDRSVLDNPRASLGVISFGPSSVEQTAAPTSAGVSAARPSGHGASLTTRVDGVEGNFSPTHSPANGMNTIPHTPLPVNHVHEFHSHTMIAADHNSTSHRLSKFNFPTYDGDTTKLWITQAEDYFDMYGVPSYLWVKVAGMHFNGAAKRWIQSLDRPSHQIPWTEFCSLLLERFARNQHGTLIRQMFHISQTTTVVDYVDRFSTLIDQLKAYTKNPDMHTYITRFVDGLRTDIRSVVALQCPNDLDTAYSLALLQEEVSALVTKNEYPRVGNTPGFKTNFRHAHPLPRPPQADKPAEPPAAQAVTTPTTTDKLSELRQYRRAQGLCDRCAEKWFRGHKCPPQIQLHVMQELWDAFELDEIEQSPDEPSEQLLLALSHDAHKGLAGSRTIQFQGCVHGIPVVVLVDSGSSASFLAAAIASKLPHLPRSPLQANVKIANGHLMQCTSALLQCQFSLYGHSFQHDLRILPLDSYDLILGMDWLELYSPMHVHWPAKWISLSYAGTSIVLHGLTVRTTVDMVFQLVTSDYPESSGSDSPLPPDIEALLAEFPAVFSTPSGLPPARPCDHIIPLVNGATPVNIRAYRYPPTLKDEIERQVRDLLDKGFIQPSSSPFSSPVLLVRKKDGSWRFCVDYRYLNAMTIKLVYPIPIFDQLVDELGSASWFSILDLHSGYHQIRLQSGEEFKTAFSTHAGHYEFTVVPFGLSGAPGTFQGAMNSTLASLLRKSVVVFFDDILIFSNSYEEHLQHLHAVLSLLAKDQCQWGPATNDPMGIYSIMVPIWSEIRTHGYTNGANLSPIGYAGMGMF